MSKPTPTPAPRLRAFQAQAIDRTQQQALKGGQGSFIIIDDLDGI